MKQAKITVFSISDPTGTSAPSAGANGDLGRLALQSDLKIVQDNYIKKINTVSPTSNELTFVSDGTLEILPQTSGTVLIRSGPLGWQSVVDTAARDAIPADRRVLGMVVYCQDTKIEYQLQNGITNGDWVDLLDNVVHMTDAEVISGQKTFNDNLIVTAALSATADAYLGASPAILKSGRALVDTVTNQVIEQFPDTLGSGAKWLMNLKNGPNVRTSEIMCAWDSSTDALIANEVSTQETGTTANVTYNVTISSNNVQLRVSSVSNGWSVKFFRTLL